MISAVALSPSLDVTYVVASLHGIQRPLEVHRMAGGKALNAARAAATLGAEVAAVTVLGGGAGAMVADGARAAGVDLEVVASPHLTRTCVSVLAQDTAELTEIYEHPTPVGRELLDEVLRRVPGMLERRPGWCLVSGGMPRDLGDQVLVEVLRAARATGVRVAVDSHGPALGAAVTLAPPEVVKVNRAEAAELTGLSAGGELVELAAAVHAMTGGLAVVTGGPAGAAAVDGDSAVHVVLDGPVGSFPVGSGDSFLGGLLVGLDHGQSLPDAMRLATACGTANALVPGAARFDRAVVERLAGEVRVTRRR